jgi:hypothetical protein
MRVGADRVSVLLQNAANNGSCSDLRQRSRSACSRSRLWRRLVESETGAVLCRYGLAGAARFLWVVRMRLSAGRSTFAISTPVAAKMGNSHLKLLGRIAPHGTAFSPSPN